MNNLMHLLKINFYSLFNLQAIFHQKDKKVKYKTLALSILFIFVPIIAMFYVYLYVSLVAKTFYQMQLLDFLIGAIFAIISFTTLVASIYKVYGLILETTDYELLKSLPISNTIIILSKWLSLYLLNLGFTIIILIPSLIHYISYINPPISFYLILIITTFLIPLIPMGVGCLLGILVKYIASKFKNPQIISIILMMAFTVGIVSTFTFTDPNQLINLLTDFTQLLNQIYPLSKLYIETLCHQNIVSLFIFILINLVVFFGVMAIISKNFTALNSLPKYNHRTKKEIKTHNHSVIMCLFQKEFKRYISSSIYVTNTIAGMVLLTFMSIFIAFNDIDRLSVLLDIPFIAELAPIFLPLMICMTIGISNTAVNSISLEANQLWIIKALPILPLDIFKAKIMVNVLVTIPLGLFNVVLLGILLHFSWIDLILGIINISIFSLLSAIIGLIINLALPKLEWKSEVTVIKQSSATLINLIVDFAYVGSFMLIAYDTNGQTIISIAFMLLSLFAMMMSYLFLKYKGQKIFKNIG